MFHDSISENGNLLTGWTVPPLVIASWSFCAHLWACNKRTSCCIMSFLFSESWFVRGPPVPAIPGIPEVPGVCCWGCINCCCWGCCLCIFWGCCVLSQWPSQAPKKENQLMASALYPMGIGHVKNHLLGSSGYTGRFSSLFNSLQYYQAPVEFWNFVKCGLNPVN